MNTPSSPAASLVPHAAISFRAAVWCLVVGMALVVPVGLLNRLLPLPHPDLDMVRVSAARMAPLHSHAWLLALHALVVAPLWEEFVYRGLILQLLRRYTPLWLAVLLPTLIFAGTHLPFGYGNAVTAAVVGLVFTGLVLRSRSLLTSMLCHAGVNLAAIFVLRPLAEVLGRTTSPAVSVAALVVLAAGSVAALILGGRVLRSEFNRPSRVVAPSPAVSLAAA